MIRMIGNNTSDYVATDLIRNLWCQHDEKYGHLFPDEPHNGRKPCTFEHGHMEKVRKMYSTGGDSYQFPHQESRILIAPKSIINIDKTSSKLNPYFHTLESEKKEFGIVQNFFLILGYHKFLTWADTYTKIGRNKF